MVSVRLLQLYVHVFRHGGINRAAGRKPFCLQASTLSEQMKQLEEGLGQKLFERQPFRPTAAGAELFAIVEPLLARLDQEVTAFCERTAPCVRFAGDPCLGSPKIAAVVTAVVAALPGCRVDTHHVSATTALDGLRAGKIDLALVVTGSKRPAGLAWKPLGSLRLVLLVPKDCPVRTAEALWTQPRLTQALVCPAENEAVGQAFQKGLRLGGIHWTPTVVSPLGLIADLVALGRHIGVDVDAPWRVAPRRVRVLPLKGFEPVQVAVVWRPPDASRWSEVVRAISREPGRGFAAAEIGEGRSEMGNAA